MDPNTGLPALPEPDLFWRVADTRTERYEPFRKVYGYELRLMRERTVKKERMVVVTKRTWWGGTREVNKPVLKDVSSPTIVLSRLVAQNSVDLTPKAIREAAEALLSLHNERVRAAALLGDYPPKNLPVSLTKEDG